MNDRITGVVGTAALASLVIVCCAGPLLVVAAASLGAGAWLVAHGLWLLGGLGLLLAGAASIAAYCLRQAGAACAPDQRGALAELQHPAVRHAPPAATILRNHPKGATV